MLSQNMIKPHEEVVESAFFGIGVQVRKNLQTDLQRENGGNNGKRTKIAYGVFIYLAKAFYFPNNITE